MRSFTGACLRSIQSPWILDRAHHSAYPIQHSGDTLSFFAGISKKFFPKNAPNTFLVKTKRLDARMA
jgi:hypothetical protein